MILSNMKLKSLLVLCYISTVGLTSFYFLVKFLQFDPNKELDGWGYNMTRNASQYFNAALSSNIVPKNLCRSQHLLVTMVHSAPENFEARRAIRDTWGQSNENVSLLFLLGRTDDNLVQRTLEVESACFDDIVQGNFTDTYFNLTLKTVFMVKLFNDNCRNSTMYLFKTDDDVFNNIDKLTKMLSQRDNYQNVLIGRRIQGAGVYRNPTNKWYSPIYLYPQDTYPDYLEGKGYVMSADVAEKLLRAIPQTPLFHIEDVYLTGMCATVAGIHPQMDVAFVDDHRSICSLQDVYTSHGFSPSDLRDTYSYIKSNCY